MVTKRLVWAVAPRRYKAWGRKPQVIIEDAAEAGKTTRLLHDFKHYLKTTEVPSSLRAGILQTKLQAFAKLPDFPAKALPVLNSTWTHIDASKLPKEDLYSLFEKSAAAIKKNSLPVPRYMAHLAQEFAKENVPNGILALVVELGATERASGLAGALRFVAESKNGLPEGFIREFCARNKPGIQFFEDLEAIHRVVPFINDEYAEAFMDHVERLFEETAPEVHEHKDLERHTHRILHLALNAFGGASLTPLTRLKALKFVADLRTVAENSRTQTFIDSAVAQLSANINHTLEEISSHKNLDESLLQCWLLNGDGDALLPLCDYIIKDDIWLSKGLRLQAQYIANSLRGISQDGLLLDFEGEPKSEMQERLVQAAVAIGLDPDAASNLVDVEPSLTTYQTMINATLSNPQKAFEIFERSLKTTEWSENHDPSVGHTFSMLITAIANDTSDIMQLFPVFRKVKQHMAAKCNASALDAMARRMLDAECVGDTIEMLKRELPPIKSEDIKKLPVVADFASANRNLFKTLHEFVISYTNEETHETNWVLYGELHKYFEFPFASYLPAMEFFCSKNRLNAALVILRQVKRLNELHGGHSNLPPLREMYMLLLRTFGDKLYEEGVLEVHEMLKMDVHLPQQDIELQNCVLNAYADLQNVDKARDLFLVMSSDAKQFGGVNEKTAQIMIKAYTYTDILYVKKFWNNLSQFGIFPNYEVYKQFLIAHVYHGQVDEAIQLIESIGDYDVEFSSDLLLAMHNFCLEPSKQKIVDKWAAETHPDAWQEAILSGLLRSATEYLPERNLVVGT